MKETPLMQRSDEIVPAPIAEMGNTRRLIVLVSNDEMDEAELAQEIWQMAFASHLEVLLLGISMHYSDEYPVQRRLITLAALIEQPLIHVKTRLAHGRNWLRVIKPLLEEGDVIVCHAEQSMGWRRRRLADHLRSLNVPVRTLTGLPPIRIQKGRRWLASTAFWVGALTILAIFFYLQIQVNSIQDELTKTVFLVLSILVELACLYQWNLVFS